MKISKGEKNPAQTNKRSKNTSDQANKAKKRKFDLDDVGDGLNSSKVEVVNAPSCDNNMDDENESINSDSDDCKENFNVCDQTKIQNLQRITETREKKLKKKNKGKNRCSLEVSKKKACNVIELLQKPKKNQDVFKQSCKFQLKPFSGGKEYGWDSCVHIMKHLQYCILNQEWHNFPDLILLLLRHPGQAMKLFKHFIKEMSYLNFLVNSDSGNADLLDQFYQQIFVTIPAKKMKPLEVWYRDE